MAACKYTKKSIGFLLMWCMSNMLFAQSSGTPLLDKKVSLAQCNIRLDSMLQSITRQTGIKFSYNSRRLNTTFRVQLPTTNNTVKQIFEELNKATGVRYTLIESHIILTIEKSTLQKPARAESEPAKITQSNRRIAPKEKHIRDTTSVKNSGERNISGSEAGYEEPFVNPIDTITHKLVVADPDKKADSIPTAKATILPAVAKKKVLPAKPVPAYFIDFGISAEETLFMGATIQAGLPKIYGSVSLKSNGKSVLLLYGLGTSRKLNKKTRLLLTTQIGPYKKDFTSASGTHGDSTVLVDSTAHHTVRVRGTLARFTAGVEWNPKPNGNWKFHAGLNFNALQSRYQVNGKNSGLGSIDVKDAEQKFSVMHPFYTLSNTFQDNLSVTLKTWIGLEIGIRYTINLK